MICSVCLVNTLRLEQNGGQYPDDNCKCIFLNENVWILIKISLKFVPKGPINNIPVLVHIMAWHRAAGQATSHYLNQWRGGYWSICVTWPQRVKEKVEKLNANFLLTPDALKKCEKFCQPCGKIVPNLINILKSLRKPRIYLTHCGLVMPYGNEGIGQHLNQCWIIVNWSSDIHLRAVSREISQPPITWFK